MRGDENWEESYDAFRRGLLPPQTTASTNAPPAGTDCRDDLVTRDVWHCYIIDHEDNEMMRPDTVRLNPLAPPPAKRLLVRGIDY